MKRKWMKMKKWENVKKNIENEKMKKWKWERETY